MWQVLAIANVHKIYCNYLCVPISFARSFSHTIPFSLYRVMQWLTYIEVCHTAQHNKCMKSISICLICSQWCGQVLLRNQYVNVALEPMDTQKDSLFIKYHLNSNEQIWRRRTNGRRKIYQNKKNQSRWMTNWYLSQCPQIRWYCAYRVRARVPGFVCIFSSVSHISGGKSCDDYAHRVCMWYIVDTQ